MSTAADLPKAITLGEKYGPAMNITDQGEADAYFEKCVRQCMSHGRTRAEAEDIERSNIGYWTGYYDSETAARVFRLFRCAHPIFGTGRPSPERAFEAGRRMSERDKEGKP